MSWPIVVWAMSSPFVIGFAGAVVALKGAPGKTWGERIFNAGCGAALAGFLSAAIAEWLGLRTPEMKLAFAFVVGLFGMNMVHAINIWLRDLKLADVLPWIKRS